MIKTTKIFLILSGVMFTFLVAMNVGAFGDESYRRQQSQADDGFGDLEKEFAAPEAAKPAPPKIIIKEKIIIREKLVPVPVPIPTPTPIPESVKKAPVTQPSVLGRTVSSRGFDFTLKGCVLVDRNIECGFTVTSPKDDKNLTLYGYYGEGSLLFDNVGNKYLPRLVLFGNNESPSYVGRRLIIGIATSVKLYFNNVSSETSSIALLELLANDGKSGFRLKFRDVPLNG